MNEENLRNEDKPLNDVQEENIETNSEIIENGIGSQEITSEPVMSNEEITSTDLNIMPIDVSINQEPTPVIEQNNSVADSIIPVGAMIESDPNLINNNLEQQNIDSQQVMQENIVPVAQETTNNLGYTDSSQLGADMPLPVSLDTITTLPPVEVPLMSEQTPQPNISSNLDQTQVTTFNQPMNESVPPKKKNNKLIIIIGGVVVLLVATVLIYFLVIKKDDNKDNKKNNNDDTKEEEKKGSGNVWDPSTSKIKEVTTADSIKLTCKKTATTNEITDSSIIIYIFKDNLFLQAIIEEEIAFTKNSIKYYNYYALAAAEELAETDGTYDNVIMELRKKDMSISYIYSIDMTADATNPNNLLDSTGMNFDSAKLGLEKEGYVCE